jgi:hypothetical protein
VRLDTARPTHANEEHDHPLLRLMVLVAACVAAVIVLYLVFVRTEHGQIIDNKPVRQRTVVDQDTLDVANRVLETITFSSLALAAGALVFVALIRERLLLAFAVGTAILGANVTSELLKRVVLERPALIDTARAYANTYPSGHATVAMSLAVGAVLVVPRRMRAAAAVAGGAYAAAVSSAILVTARHRPSDVAAAAFVAVGWGAAVAAVLVWWRGTGRDLPSFRPPAIRASTWLLAFVGAIALVVVGLAASALVAHAGFDDVVIVERGKALAVAVVSMVAIDFAMLALLLAGLREVTLDPPRALPADEQHVPAG